MEWSKKVLLGTIGYHNLSNHSIGPILCDQMRTLDWSGHISIEEMNWGPIAIIQWFQALETPFDRVILFSAIHRKERDVGDVTIFKWRGGTPEPKDIQARIGDAVTGVISPENLLIIGEHFGIWPAETFLVDVEPGSEKAGPTLSTEVAERVIEYFDLLRKLCLQGEESDEKFAILYGDQMPIE